MVQPGEHYEYASGNLSAALDRIDDKSSTIDLLLASIASGILAILDEGLDVGVFPREDAG